MTIPEQLAAAQAEVETLKAALASAKEQHAKVAADLSAALDGAKAAEVARVQIQTALEASKTENAKLQADVDRLNAEAKAVAQLATEAVARVGVQPVAPENPKAAAASDLTLDEVRAKLATATGAEKSKLLILSAKLRGQL